tara:strand:+ start:732 stop:1577 length:846 start_codon:yes stop_codon:yes gene_type:complete
MLPKSASELSEQIKICEQLKKAKLDFFSVPNGGRRSRNEAIKMKMSGLQPGIPDLLIITPPPKGGVGTALEMKREDGKPADLSFHQRRWLNLFDYHGWSSVVGYGAADAIQKLRNLGYVLVLFLAFTSTPANAEIPTYIERRDLAGIVEDHEIAHEIEIAAKIANVDPLWFAAVTYTESRWVTNPRDGDGGNSVGLWQMTAGAIKAVIPSIRRSAARKLAREPIVRSVIAGLFWRRVIRKYGRSHAAAVYTCGPKCRRMKSTATSRRYHYHFLRLSEEAEL